MPLPNDNFNTGKEIYYTEDFKVLVRSERESLRREASYYKEITPAVIYAFRNDFYRLLRTQGTPPYLWWATAYINDIHDPFADISHLSLIMKINEEGLANRIARNNTTRA